MGNLGPAFTPSLDNQQKHVWPGFEAPADPGRGISGLTKASVAANNAPSAGPITRSTDDADKYKADDNAANNSSRQALELELDLAKKALEARCAENEALRNGMKKLLGQLQTVQYMESAASQEALFCRDWINEMSNNPRCEACAYRTPQPVGNMHPPPTTRPQYRLDIEDEQESEKRAQNTEERDELRSSRKTHTQASEMK